MKTEQQLAREANEVRRRGGIVWKDMNYPISVGGLKGYVSGELTFKVTRELAENLKELPRLWSEKRAWRTVWLDGRERRWYLTKEAAIHAAEMIHLYRKKVVDDG